MSKCHLFFNAFENSVSGTVSCSSTLKVNQRNLWDAASTSLQREDMLEDKAYYRKMSRKLHVHWKGSLSSEWKMKSCFFRDCSAQVKRALAQGGVENFRRDPTRKPYSITSRTHSLRDKVNGAAYPLFSDINDISSLTANKRGWKTNSFTATGKTKNCTEPKKMNILKQRGWRDSAARDTDCICVTDTKACKINICFVM